MKTITFFLILTFSFYAQTQNTNEIGQRYLKNNETHFFKFENVTSDYGPRGNSHNFHGGVDFNNKGDNCSSSSIGDGIIVENGGNIESIICSQNGLKSIVLSNGITYRHIFTGNSGSYPGNNLSSPISLGGFHLVDYDPSSARKYAIITPYSDTVAYAEVSGVSISLFGNSYTTTNNVSTGDVIAPIGNSGELPSGASYDTHLHLQKMTNIFGSLDDDENTENPLSDLIYDINPFFNSYEIELTTEVIINEFRGNVSIPLKAKVSFSNIEESSCSYSGERRYTNSVFDVERLDIQIKNIFENTFNTISGNSREAYINLGGLPNTTPSPSNVGLSNDTDYLGSWENTGIHPYAYGLHDYDDYYFTEFIPRIAENDSFSSSLLLADLSSEARYPDGDYYLRTELTDAKNQKSYSEETPIIIDNFRPYVERVLIIFSLNDVYDKKWQRNGDVMELVGSDQSVTFEDGDEFHVRIFSSEPLEELNLQVEDIAGVFPLNPNTSKTQWDIDLIYSGPTIQRDLILTGFDTNNNQLLRGENIPDLNNHLISTNTSGRMLNDNLTGEDRTHKINATDPCNITANAGSNVTIQNGSSTTLQGSGGGSCSWSPTTGLSNPNSCTTTASPTQTTTYTLTVTENGCTDTDTVTVTVDGSNAGNEPVNDNCNDAINLTSNTNCNTTFGTIDYATDDGFPNNPSCDVHSNPNTFGVFYSFTAVSNTHNIIVEPTGQLDAVVTVYSGSNCYNLSEFDCEDTSGGNGMTTTLTNNNFVIGEEYWIRVYDYGNVEPPIGQGGFNICITHQSSNTDGIDLISDITSVSNDNPDAGNTITINYTGSNIGDEPTTTLPTISFYLSTNTTLSGADDFLSSEIILQTISANETVNGNIEVTLPDVADGQYYLVSSIDNLELIDESNENNNVSFYAIQIGDVVPNGPDLDVRNVDVIPNSNLIPGQEVDIEVRIENEGTEDVDSFTVLVYFDINGNNGYDGGNEYMGEFTFNSLDAGDDETMIVDFDLPVEIYTIGNYEIFAIADSDNAINETNENNNDDDQNVTIGYVYDGLNDDVRVIDETIDITNVNAGSDVFVTSNHIYLGSQSDSNVPTLDLGYYLSTDCALSSDDIFLDDDSSGIGNDDPIKFEDQTLTIPPATPTGTYYILFVADMNNEVNEGTLENNNVVCIEISINNSNGANGDVYITDEVCNPTDVIMGSEIEPYINVHYTGTLTNAEFPSVAVYYYLSDDCTLSTDDILVSDDSISLGSDLPINDTSDAIELPNNLSPGIYYIIFQADAENVVFETDENNNIACAQFNLLPADANYQDVTFNSPYVAVTEASFGDQVYASIHQNYTGYQADADIASIRMEYYLSTDCTLSADDYYFTTDVSSLGYDDPSQFEFATLTIPTTISAGPYYILFVADTEDIIAENNESNNTECVPITITETLGIEDNELVYKIKVYPNPVNDILTINLGKAYSKINIEVYNVIGQKINSLTYGNKQIISVNTSYLSNGIYFFNIEAGSIKSVRFKIIKE